jgi:colicin import membrane protein
VDKITAMLDKTPPPQEAAPSDKPATIGSIIGKSDAKMTASELDWLRARLSECWSPPIGWSDPSEVRVVLMLHLNADGSISGTPDVLEAPGGRYAQTAPESALRAVRRCAPYGLPPDKYDAWKQVKVTFDPTDMGGA